MVKQGYIKAVTLDAENNATIYIIVEYWLYQHEPRVMNLEKSLWYIIKVKQISNPS